MKQAVLFLTTVFLSTVIRAQQLKPVDDAGAVKFSIKNLGFNVEGHFEGLAGVIVFDPQNLATCSFNVTIKASTVNTGSDMRDNHLRGEDYFDVENHPLIQFESTKVTASNRKGTLFVFGKLTIKGITKEISFPFKASPEGDGYVFTGEFSLNRKDFQIGGGSTISDKLTVFLQVKSTKG